MATPPYFIKPSLDTQQPAQKQSKIAPKAAPKGMQKAAQNFINARKGSSSKR